MKRKYVAALPLVLAWSGSAWASTSCPAHASDPDAYSVHITGSCGGFAPDTDVDVVVIGTHVELVGMVAVHYAALCMHHADDTIQFQELTGCDEYSSAAVLSIEGDATDDSDAASVAPLDTTIDCDGNTMTAWDTNFGFGLWYNGYGGADHVYGTPNQDYLFAYDYNDQYGMGLDYDSYHDTLCGYDGDDCLYGDQRAIFGPTTCSDGGSGLDLSENTNYKSVSAHSGNGATVDAYTDPCSCGSAPPSLWAW
jgi:hypothetical protein